MAEETYYIDIHSHYLFAVDDGSPNIEQSLAMLKQAAAQNIAIVQATPHATDLTNDVVSKQFLENFSRLQQQVRKAGITVDILLASELFFSPHIYEWLQYPWATFNNQKKYLLFELPLYKMPEGVGDFIFQCQLKGIHPILAHPERYIYLHRRREVLLDWNRQGCLMQMNAGSLLGQFGQEVGQFSRQMLQAQMIHFIASDAHDVEFRNYEVLQRSRQQIEDFLPRWYLDQLYFANAEKALAGEKLAPLKADENLFLKQKPFWEKLKHRFIKK